MAVTASISISQGSDPSKVIITDDSTNESEETYTARTLTILDSSGAALTGYANPIDFDFADYPDDVFTVEGLTTDKALSITLTLTPTTPVIGSVYTSTEEAATNRFLQQGLYNIQEARFVNDTLKGHADKDAQSNSIDLIIEMNNSQTAVQYSSLVGAQHALDRGQTVIDNQIL